MDRTPEKELVFHNSLPLSPTEKHADESRPRRLNAVQHETISAQPLSFNAQCVTPLQPQPSTKGILKPSNLNEGASTQTQGVSKRSTYNKGSNVAFPGMDLRADTEVSCSGTEQVREGRRRGVSFAAYARVFDPPPEHNASDDEFPPGSSSSNLGSAQGYCYDGTPPMPESPPGSLAFSPRSQRQWSPTPINRHRPARDVTGSLMDMHAKDDEGKGEESMEIDELDEDVASVSFGGFSS